MSRDRVMPRFFQQLSARSANPWAATLAMSAVNVVLLALALGTSSIAAALTNAASSLGLISIVFYGITAAAALRQQRATLASSVGNLIFGGVLPLIGVAFSLWVIIESLATGAVTTTVMLYGLGSIFVGAVVAVFLHRFMGVSFFNSLHSARSAMR
jgi:amino acid transporter